MFRKYEVGDHVEITEGKNKGVQASVQSEFTTTFGKQFMDVMSFDENPFTVDPKTIRVRASDVNLIPKQKENKS